MIFRRRLRKPNIPRIAGQLTDLQRRRRILGNSQLAAGGVDEIGAELEVRQLLRVGGLSTIL
jgi:hypothetical protein